MTETAAERPPFDSVASPSFAAILDTLGISLIVTTYQSGRVILLRADGGALNTHMRTFQQPMGVAFDGQRLALGTQQEIWELRNHAIVTPYVEPAGKHDACFLPRHVHVTGNIRIHELAFVNGELWAVNTAFSALCTLDTVHSFIPRWSPPFITSLTPEDRCHLNGFAVADERVRLVTAFAASDAPVGWREHKLDGGIVIDVESGEIVLEGLSMPHSPRHYAGRDWVLESGKGTLSLMDTARGACDVVAELPGFTRGLAFSGPFAFVGLSKVRESNVFGGIPLLERVPERECGVSVIDLRTGNLAAFLRFEGKVDEIFDVQVLPGLRYPELLSTNSPLIASSFAFPQPPTLEQPEATILFPPALEHSAVVAAEA